MSGDETAAMVLAVLQGLKKRLDDGEHLQPPQQDRVACYCAPELRYDYTGRETSVKPSDQGIRALSRPVVTVEDEERKVRPINRYRRAV